MVGTTLVATTLVVAGLVVTGLVVAGLVVAGLVVQAWSSLVPGWPVALLLVAVLPVRALLGTNLRRGAFLTGRAPGAVAPPGECLPAGAPPTVCPPYRRWPTARRC